ncbi:MAG: urease accessory protein UreH domain-containing protein [Gammaproteobacteria bacterium]
MKQQHYLLSVSGMQCVDCENHIEEAVLALPGIIEAKASFTDETLSLDLDSKVISVKTVCAAVKSAGYDCSENRSKPTGLIKRLFLSILALSGIILLFQLDNLIHLDFSLDDVGQSANYGLLFMVGVLTSFHCIGMCGGFVISYTVADTKTATATYWNHALYGVGKIVSYSGFGALFGLIGGALTFTLGMRSLVSALAGAFLILYGLSMLEAFSALRRLHIRLPRVFNRFLAKLRLHTSNPLIFGLLNGMMIACGPLQAMYIMAAGTESPVQGAKLLAVFALGTLPVMTAFGTFASMISANATRYFIKISGFIIILLGAVMLNRSMMIAGTGYDVNSLMSRVSQEFKAHFMTWQHDHADAVAHIQEGYQIIYMEAEQKAYIPDEFTLRYGVPVKWIINVKVLSNCNKKIIVPSLDMTIGLKPGLQVVEFTPRQVGAISWSCHMGMIPGTFIVKK